MPAPDHPIIQLENLQFRWPRDRHDILDIRNFAVFPEQRVFIKGANGSGKTTLLSLLGACDVAVLGIIIGAGFLVGAIPAVRAYRYSLADGMTIRI